MTTKTLEEVKELAKGYDLVPIQEEIFADLVTPIQLLRKIAAGKKNYYLLESVEGGEKWGRYSFLGYDPVMRVSCRENTVTIKQRQETKTVETDDCFRILRDILAEHKAPKIEGMPPFAGGFVGYFAYAMIAQAEKKLSVKRGEFEDYDLMMFDKVIAYDHLKQKIVLIVNVRADGDIAANYAKAKADIKGMIALIRDESRIPEEPIYDKVKFECNVTEDEYTKIVEKTKEIFSLTEELPKMLQSPIVSKDAKHRLIEDIFPEEIRNFLKVVSDHQEMDLMDDIFVAYKKAYDENHGILCAEMSYVMEPDAKQVEQMKAYLANKYGKQMVELSMVEDKSLIGGFVLRVGDKEEDYSMKGRLDRLEKRLTWR